MINILSSDAVSKSEEFRDVPREGKENNQGWLKRNLPSNGEQGVLVMVGGKSPTDFRLRTAQADVRSDLSPSRWSHAMLLKNPAERETSKVYEISLEPEDGFGFPTPDNAVQEGDLGRYKDVKKYPNIACLHIPVAQTEIEQALGRFKMQRAVLDGVDLTVRWLAYVWGVGRSGNPLLEGYGIPSAAMLEIVVGAAGFDLTPGLESRSSCPEAISQAAKYWHEYYKDQNKAPLTGCFYAPHEIK